MGLRVRAGDGVNDVVRDNDGVATILGVSVLCVVDMLLVCEGVVSGVELAVPLLVPVQV